MLEAEVKPALVMGVNVCLHALPLSAGRRADALLDEFPLEQLAIGAAAEARQQSLMESKEAAIAGSCNPALDHSSKLKN
jgi:hypothetical protein